MTPLLDEVVPFLEARGLRVDVERVEDGARIDASAADDDGLPWQVFVGVDEVDRRVGVYGLGLIPIPREQRGAVAMLLTKINYGLTIGNFELDLDDGDLRYKTSIDVGADPLTPTLLAGLFGANVAAMREYLDTINGLAIGVTTLEQALSAVDDF